MTTAAGAKEAETAVWDNAKAAITKVWRRCAGLVLKGSPPEVCEEVDDLLHALKIQEGHLLAMYSVFHELRQAEVDEIVVSATEIEVDGVLQLVTVRKKWVKLFLTHMLKLGECEETVCWDEFLWIFLRFCSLDRVELGQVLFLIIAKELDTPQTHYLTADEIADFYWLWRDCPVKSFNTEAIDFDKLPHSRYYASDFCEIVQRFPRLLNPILHLQQSMQARLPSHSFWDTHDQTSFTRKITPEFFTMNMSRVYLRGEPPFRETCDMLSPDSLGALSTNEDHWILRTNHKRLKRGLRQISVWGEQYPPEVVDEWPHSSQVDKVLSGAASLGNNFVDNKNAANKATAAQTTQHALPAPPAAPGPPVPNAGSTIGNSQQPQQGTPLAPPHPPPAPAVAWGGAALGAPPIPENERWAHGNVRTLDSSKLCLAAAVLDEEGTAPVDCLPPAWMKNCTIAPAPVVWGPDPPLPRTIGRRRAADEIDITNH